jgi:cytoskeletal protein CcmA (bactofilin family)
MEKAGSKGYNTLLGEGTAFEGVISVPHSVRVDGQFKGKIDTEETVTIGPAGIVEADIRAKSAIILGKVKGNIFAEDRIHLESKSALVGDIKTRELVIDEGAVFDGNCAMNSEKSDMV